MTFLSRFTGRPESDDYSGFVSRFARRHDDESEFQAWYRVRALALGLDPNPDAPEHHYDYRAAFRSGAEPGPDGHWPSQFKSADHPNRFVGNVDTITGELSIGRDLAAFGAPGLYDSSRVGLPPAVAPGEEPLPSESGWSAFLSRTGAGLVGGAGALAGAAAAVAPYTPAGLLAPERTARNAQPLVDFAQGSQEMLAVTQDRLMRAQLGDAAAAEAQGYNPDWAMAATDTLADLIPDLAEAGASGVARLGGKLALKALPETGPLSRFLRRPVSEAAEAAAAAPGPGPSLDSLPPPGAATEAPTASTGTSVGEAMPHAGSDVSVEAINRVQQGNRYYRIKPSGEAVPIINDVGAVDVRVNPGEVKVRVGPDGRVLVEQGKPNAAIQRTIGNLGREEAAAKELAPQLRPPAPTDLARVAEVNRIAEDYLAQLEGRGPVDHPVPPLPFQVNPKQFDLPDEVAADFDAILQRDLPAIQAQRRGEAGPHRMKGIGDDVDQLARRAGMTKEQFLATKPGTAMNYEQIATLNSLIGNASHRVQSLAREISEQSSRGVDDLAKKAELAMAVEERTQLIRTAVGAGSEAGRALRVKQELARAMTEPERLRFELGLRYLAKCKKFRFSGGGSK